MTQHVTGELQRFTVNGKIKAEITKGKNGGFGHSKRACFKMTEPSEAFHFDRMSAENSFMYKLF